MTNAECANHYKRMAYAPFSSWSIHYDEYRLLVDLCRLNRIEKVIEFGPGASSCAFLDASCDVHSYECDANWLTKHQSAMRALDFVFPRTECHEMMSATPEQPFTSSRSKTPTYDVTFLPSDQTPSEADLPFHPDLILVDGPPYIQGEKYSRLQACLFSIKLSGRIILHDAYRKGEKNTLELLRNQGYHIQVIPSPKGLALVTDPVKFPSGFDLPRVQHLSSTEVKERFLVLSKNGDHAAQTIAHVLAPLGHVEIIVDQQTLIPEGTDAKQSNLLTLNEGGVATAKTIYIPDDCLQGFEGMTTGMVSSHPYTAWGRAVFHVLATRQPDEAIWFIEDDVALQPDSIRKLLSRCRSVHVDLAAWDITPRSSDPDWPFWHLTSEELKSHSWRSFNPICRVSAQMLDAVSSFSRETTTLGFHEILWATLAMKHGMRVLDWHSDRLSAQCFGTYRFRPAVTETTHGICHPVKDPHHHYSISMQPKPLTEIDALLEELREFLETDRLYLWHIDTRVWFDGDWETLMEEFAENDADLLATHVRNRDSDPEWWHWRNFYPPASVGSLPHHEQITAFLWCMRLSRKAATFLLENLDNWQGHQESTFPTLLHHQGCKVRDIGPQWYDDETWKWQGSVILKKGKLHHPIEQTVKTLSPFRFTREVKDHYKILFASPVGVNAKSLLPHVIQSFRSAGVDILLMQYDDAELELEDVLFSDDCEHNNQTSQIKLIKSKGYKWQLAMKHVSPELVAKYDYIFLWDDDLELPDFDAQRFVTIMAKNHLSMAQPSITSPHGIAHHITKMQAHTTLLREENGSAYMVVGRLTNFVEVMAPVFSREGWQEFFSYITAENNSGYGFDYIPLPRKGIIDVMPIIHTRAMQSNSAKSFREMRQFFEQTGLKKYEQIEMGCLYE